jgi:opacity protein-like surface antigen
MNVYRTLSYPLALTLLILVAPAAQAASNYSGRSQTTHHHRSAEAVDTETSLGFRAGGTAAGVDTSGGTSSKLGFMGGLNLNLPLSNIFSIQPEADFIQEGTGIDTGTTALSASIDLNYLQFPLLLKAAIPTGVAVRPYGLFGPSLGILVGKSASITNTNGTTAVGDPAVQTLDYGLNFGAGLDIDVTRKVALVLDLRYYLGLANINSTAGATTHNRGFQFLSGLQFVI